MSKEVQQSSPLKRALLALEKMQARLEAAERARREPIAIIGVGCRFPGGANHIGAFWELLRDGVDTVTEVPADRWDVDAYYDPDPEAPGKMYTRWGAFLDQVDQFDPQFFGITPREAASMDPQQRLLLEVAWEALEDAAQAQDHLLGSRTGVFVGILGDDYGQMHLANGGINEIGPYYGSGVARSIASGRISYVLGLQGPSVSIDTACSSSLVAIHQAVQSLRTGECNMALAGGVNVMLVPEPTIALSKHKMMAADGRCKTFDAAADGYVRGEGVGMVVLKRLSDARRDGDNIWAVIRGTAVNQDGPSSGLTAPNGPAQEAVIREALNNAGVKPADVTYVECHGTGTSLGDPIEVQALAAVLGSERPAENPLLIGSVKTNVGHLETAAGVVGLVKVIKMLQHRAIPPHLHFHDPNPFIPWTELPVSVPTELTPWPAEAPLIAGVSSFGFSGTNVHIVVEAAPEPTPEDESAWERPSHLLTLSAKTDKALSTLARQYADHLTKERRLADVAYTANSGRAQLPYRLAVTAASAAEAREKLAAWTEGEAVKGIVTGQVPHTDPPHVAFLFTGQGAQYPGMGRQLYETQPVFREALDQCNEFLRPYLDQPLLNVLFADDDDTAALINQTAYTQPALFAIEYALAQLWLAWGVKPDYVMGHSVGEYVAACIAGVFSLEEGLKLIAARGRLMQALPAGGSMAAVFADEATALEAIAPHVEKVSIAAVNGPTNVVISGEETAVTAILETLQEQGIKSRALVVSHAFHSPLMDPMLDEFAQIAADVAYHSPQLRLISNVNGELALGDIVTNAAYWRDHVRAAVQFAPAVQTLYAKGVDVLLEIGPQPTLLGMARRITPEQDGYEPAYLPSLRQNKDDWMQLLDSLAQLWCVGVAVDWDGFDRPYLRRKLRLPTYPFQRKRYWIPERAQPSIRPLADAVHPLLGRRLRSALPQTQHESELSVASFAFIQDHQVQHTPLLPMTAYLEMALAAAQQQFGYGNHVLEDVIIHEPMVFAGGTIRAVQFIVSPEEENAASFNLFSREEGDGEAWQLHASGYLRRGGTETAASTPEPIAAIQERCSQSHHAADHYAWLHERGFHFGPAMQGVAQVWWREGEALGEIHLPEPVAAEGDLFRIHPSLLDSCLQFFGTAVNLSGSDTYLPMSLERVQVYGRPAGRIWSHIVLQSGESQDTINGDVRLLNDDNEIVAELTGLAFRRTGQQALLRALGIGFADWYVELSWQPDGQKPPLLFPPAEIASPVAAQVAGLSDKHDLATYHELFPQLEALGAGYVAAAFQALGWQFQPGECVTAASLQEKLGIAPRYGRLLRHLLHILSQAGWLQPDGEAWIVESTPAPDNLDDKWQALRQQYPASQAQITLTGKCGRELARVLDGRQDPLALLFPDGSVEVAEQLYRESPQARVFNDMVAQGVQAALDRLPAEGALRMLEIGAGTGGTTSSVLPILPPDRIEYVFSDIGPLFLSRAKERFAQYDFVRYQTLDIERDPAAQGFAGQQFDLILAVNVLHATADLQQTLTHVRRLLAPGGLLLLVEGTAPENWVDITFGLTDGWWRFTDTDRRHNYPLIGQEEWYALLSETGFRGMTALPAQDGRFRQALILAQTAPYPQPGHWLILQDQTGVGQQAAAMLEAQGESCTLVAAPTPQSVPDLAQFKEWVQGDEERPLRGVVHLWNLDVPEPEDAVSLEPWQRIGSGSIVTLIQALGGLPEPPRLWLVTRGAQPVLAGEAPAAAQAPVWGLSKVIQLEHPELNTVRLDLDPGSETKTQAQALFAQLWQPDEETYLAERAGQRYRARLVHSEVKAPAKATDSNPLRLQKSPDGVLDNMTLAPIERPQPGPGQVEIRVHATGLNFRDVMNALAMRDDPDPLGGECSGVVTAVGPDVSTFAVGDAVMALAAGSFGTHVLADAPFVAHKPDSLSFVEAASFPTAFFTAYYSLIHLGKIQAGERVLIHAASGGVGTAAVQLAQWAGAEVYATASQPKWETLRQLGVEHIFNSRTLDFADEILAATGGSGVNVVLNSLAGDFVDKSVAVLAEGGRFLEIGKRDIWTPQQFAAARPDATYHLIDLAEDIVVRPTGVSPVFQEVMAMVQAGQLRPSPLKRFPLSQVANAFRYMAQTRHVGKIVVTQSEVDQKGVVLRADATYLITGGLSGLGLLTAQHLVEQGARHLVLMSRSQPSEAAQAAIAAMADKGAQIVPASGDVSNPENVARVLADIAQNLPPLRGVIHSAGVLDDAALLRQDWSKFARVMAPKVDGAWFLHRLTENLPLDFFVMYSSTSAVTGSPGQANHAAANAFMDALAHYRQAQGYPALSINWGVWSQIGSAAERKADEWVTSQGAQTIAPEQGTAVLMELMGQPKAQIGVLPLDWSQYSQQFDEAPAWLSELVDEAEAAKRKKTKIGRVATHRKVNGKGDTDERSMRPSILQALEEAPANQQRELLLNHITAQLIQVIGLDSEQEIDPQLPLSDMGLDSLMAVELRNLLVTTLALKRSLPATLVFDYPTIDALTDYLMSDVLTLTSSTQTETEEIADDDILGDIENLSDEEVEQLFAELQE